MNAQQIYLPFCWSQRQHGRQRNRDLIGRAYVENRTTVTVIDECADDDKYVIVRRGRGQTTTMLAWLMRAIFDEEDQKLKRSSIQRRQPFSIRANPTAHKKNGRNYRQHGKQASTLCRILDSARAADRAGIPSRHQVDQLSASSLRGIAGSRRQGRKGCASAQ